MPDFLSGIPDDLSMSSRRFVQMEGVFAQVEGFKKRLLTKWNLPYMMTTVK